MNRRQFIARTLAAAGLLAGGGLLVARFVRRVSEGARAHAWESELFDPQFAAYAVDNDISEAVLLEALVAKRVLATDGQLDAARVRVLAREDAIVAYGNSLYTETELQLYALASLRARRSH